MKPNDASAPARPAALRQRVAGRVAALAREYKGRVRLGQELTHFARLLILRDDTMDDLAAGKLEVQRLRLLSETNRQIESCGARLGIFSPMPRAGEQAESLEDEEDEPPAPAVVETNWERRGRLARQAGEDNQDE